MDKVARPCALFYAGNTACLAKLVCRGRHQSERHCASPHGGLDTQFSGTHSGTHTPSLVPRPPRFDPLPADAWALRFLLRVLALANVENGTSRARRSTIQCLESARRLHRIPSYDSSGHHVNYRRDKHNELLYRNASDTEGNIE
jgi:hypothetical protein